MRHPAATPRHPSRRLAHPVTPLLAGLAAAGMAVVLPATAPRAAHARATAFWDGGAGAVIDWSDPLNWAGDALPAAGDDVSIGAFATSHNTSLLTPGLSFNSVATAGALTLSGGTLAANTLTFAGSGSLLLSGGALRGATINNPAAVSFTSSTANLLDGVTLGGVAGLTVGKSGYVRVANGLTFAPGAVFTLASADTIVNNTPQTTLAFDSTAANPNATFDNANVNVLLGNIGGQDQTRIPSYIAYGQGFGAGSTAILTLGPNLSVQGTAVRFGQREFGYAGAGTSLVNCATLVSDENGIWALDPGAGTFRNQGTLRASDTSVVGTSNISVGSGGTTIGTFVNEAGAVMEAIGAGARASVRVATLRNSGILRASQGGSLSLFVDTGVAVNETGGLIEVGGAGASLFASSSLQNLGTVRVTGGATINSLSINNAAAGVVEVTGTGTTLAFSTPSGAPNAGTVRAAGGGATLTFTGANAAGGVVEASGANSVLNVSASGFSNAGVVRATGGGRVSLLSVPLPGRLEAHGTNSVVVLRQAGATTAPSAPFVYNSLDLGASDGGVIRVERGITIDNSGKTLDLSPLAAAGGFLLLDSGTLTGNVEQARIKGGTLAGLSALRFGSNSGNVLDGVTLAAGETLRIRGIDDIQPATVRVQNGLTFAPGTEFDFGGTGRLTFDLTPGVGSVLFDNADLVGSSAVLNTTNEAPRLGTPIALTLGPNLTVRTRFLSIFDASYGFTNSATLVSAQGGSYSVSSPTSFAITNDGTFGADGIVSGQASRASLATGSGSTARINNNGVIRATNGGTATLTITASSGSFAGAVVNKAGGKIEASGGGTVTFETANVSSTAASSAGAVLDEGGVIDVGAGSRIQTGAAGITQSAGQTIVNGTLDLDRITAAPNPNSFLRINGGTLSGDGTIIGSVIVGGGGGIGPGNSSGSLDINGNLALNSGALLLVEIASATEFDVLNVTGNATIDPGAVLRLSFAVGYTPAPDATFDILNVTGTVTGNFGTIVDATPASAGGPRFSDGVTFDPVTGVLSFSTVAVPEPSTVALLGAGLPVAAVLLTRRQRRAAA